MLYDKFEAAVTLGWLLHSGALQGTLLPCVLVLAMIVHLIQRFGLCTAEHRLKSG